MTTSGWCRNCSQAYQKAKKAEWQTLRRGTLKVWALDRRQLSLEDFLTLREVLSRMPTRVQTMLLLWAQGYSLKHIATCLGLSDEWVTQLMKRWAPTWREYHQFAPHAITPRMREKAREVGKRYVHVAHAARWQKYHPEELP